MLTFLALIMVLLGAAMVALILYEHWVGTTPIVSLRNIALAGFAVYQITSGVIALWSGDFGVFPILSPNSTATTFVFMSALFLAVFFASYAVGFPTKQLARLTPTTDREPSDGALILLAFALTAGAAILRFTVLIPYVGIIAGWIGIGFSSIATGLMAWVWARHWLNPAVLGIAAGVALVNTIIALSGQFGRRQLAAIGLAFVWGAFYSTLRHKSFGVQLQALLVVSAPAVVAVSLYTSVRGGSLDRTATQQVQALAGGDLKAGLTDVLAGQGTATAAMWAIENYPDNFQTEPYLAITFFFTHNIPRAIWPEKPEPLSKEIAKNANVKGVNQEAITIPPGIVGYAAAEGGLPALLAYAVFFALLLRYFDELVKKNPASPLVVMPVACQLGQIIGLFRGDPSIFANIYVWSFLGCYVTCLVLGKAIEARAARSGFMASLEDEAPPERDPPTDGDPDDAPDPDGAANDADRPDDCWWGGREQTHGVAQPAPAPSAGPAGRQTGDVWW